MSSLTALVLTVLACTATLVASHRALVIVDDASIQSTHSLFLQSLRDQGLELNIKPAGSSSIEIRTYGEFVYDSLILLCPQAKEFGGDVDQASILEFVDSGNSLIVTASANVGSAVRSLVDECGAHLDSKGTVVLDHAKYYNSESDGQHALVVADNFSQSKILGSTSHKPVLFHGAALSVTSSHVFTTPLLRGNPTTYSGHPDKEIKGNALAGSAVVLVAGVQTLTRGRILVSGSLELFSNNFFSALIDGKPSGNAEFVRETVNWAIQQRGVLRAHSIFHRYADARAALPSTYRVNDDVFFSVVIEELDGRTGEWKPYDANDVQMEFRMLDPYVRLTLTSAGNGTFHTSFKIPDRYGVFKFAIDYRRDGYSHVVVTQEVGVRPFRHNEFERYIASAYPYYASAFTSMGAFVFFAIVFLFTKDKQKAKNA